MHLIVEGIDRCGKSSSIEAMRKLLPGYTVFKPRPPKSHDEARHLYSEFFQMLAEPGNVIYDRGHMSELVYARLYRDYDPISWVLDLEAEVVKQNPFIKLIYFFPIWGNLLKDDDRPGADRTAELYLYESCLNMSVLSVTRQRVHELASRSTWLTPEVRAGRALRACGVLP